MQYVKVIVLALVLQACAMPFPLEDETDEDLVFCDEMECPYNFYCSDTGFGGFCFPERDSRPSCDLECTPPAECLFEGCVSPNESGQVCEYDEVCAEGEFCISGRCTFAGCEPGTAIECYAAAAETIGVGECSAGHHLCLNNGTYTDECIGEVLPVEETGLLACDGLDNNCDGEADPGRLGPVDLIFAFDVSGSMIPEFDDTINGIRQTAAMYNGPSIELSLVTFPSHDISDAWRPQAVVPLLPYPEFMHWANIALGLIGSSTGGQEASWDVPVMILEGEIDGLELRSNSTKIIIMFTDEPGQTYTSPPNSEHSMCESVTRNNALFYVMTIQDQTDDCYIDFDECAVIFPLVHDADAMASNLSNIVTDICGN